MCDYPNTTLEFEQWFATDQACRDYLWELRFPDGFRCPRCGADEAWHTARGLRRCQKCDNQLSVTAGTVFEGTRKPLTLWFRAMWHVVNQKHGVSALGLQKALGLGSYRTAWTWLHKLRVAMVRPGRDRLAGTVEVDETYVGGERHGKRGRGAEGKALVYIAAQDDGGHIGRIRLMRIPDASAASLSDTVQKTIQPESIVRTDGWNGYNDLNELDYERRIVRHSADVGDNLLPLANRVAALLKRWLLGTHQGAVRPTHLDYYLDEYTFRFNRRTSKSRGKLFFRLVQQAVAVAPRTGDSFTA